MAVYDADGNVVSLNKVHAYADRVVKPKRISSLFARSPFLTFMTGKNKGDTNIGRPGTLALVGGSGNFSKVEKEVEAGVEVHDRLHIQTTGGGKWMAERDTTPSTGDTSQDQNVKTAVHRWAMHSQPVKIWNATMRMARGNSQIANAVREATEEAMEVQLDEIAKALMYGNPASQSANVWSSPLGVVQAIDTDNTYGNISRSASTAYYNGQRYTSAVSASLNLIDQANLGTGVFASLVGLQKYGPGCDFILTSPAIYYKLKQEALARGGAIQIGAMQAAPEVGAKFECIKYGQVTITYDPMFTGSWASYDSDITDASTVMLFLTSEDWLVSMNSAENFRITPFVDQGETNPGGDDAITANIKVMLRSRCLRPRRQAILTAVS